MYTHVVLYIMLESSITLQALYIMPFHICASHLFLNVALMYICL